MLDDLAKLATESGFAAIQGKGMLNLPGNPRRVVRFGHQDPEATAKVVVLADWTNGFCYVFGADTLEEAINLALEEHSKWTPPVPSKPRRMLRRNEVAPIGRGGGKIPGKTPKPPVTGVGEQP